MRICAVIAIALSAACVGLVGCLDGSTFIIARYNQDGSLDESYGFGGLTFREVDTRAGIQAIGIDSQKQIAAAGVVQRDGILQIGAVLRTEGGNAASGFGDQGLLTVWIVDDPSPESTPIGLAISRSSGTLITGFTVARRVRIPTEPEEMLFGVIRFEQNGVDPAFGSGGLTLTRFPGYTRATPVAVLMKADGSFVVPGFARREEGEPESVIAMAAYESDGSLDHGFGDGGRVTVAFDGEVVDGVLDSAGRILVVGHAVPQPREPRLVIARFHPNGTLDVEFGEDGFAFVETPGGFLVPQAAIVDNDDRLIVGGFVRNEGVSRLGLVRLLGSGELDASFGDMGMVVTNAGGTRQRIHDVVVDSLEGLVVCGFATRMDDAGEKFMIARFTDAGALDPSFGDGGLVIDDFGALTAFANAITLDSRGKIVVAGRAFYD